MSKAQADSWAVRAHQVLADSGHRSGQAREALVRQLDAQTCARSVLEIEDALCASGRPVARASIYRILDLLQDRGLVARLELGDAMTRYELVDPAGAHHHHLLCDSCGRLVPFDDGDLERSIDRLSRRLGFDTHEHEVILRGDCSACQA